MPAVTNPVVAPIVATLVLLLVQVPPPTASLKFVTVPIQIPVEPMIVVGNGLINTDVVVTHPPASE